MILIDLFIGRCPCCGREMIVLVFATEIGFYAIAL